jgi:hypothetical protein
MTMRKHKRRVYRMMGTSAYTAWAWTIEQKHAYAMDDGVMYH